MTDSDRLIKGTPVIVLSNRVLDGLSDVAVPCLPYNAVNVAVFVSGTDPSATVSIEGADAEGGNYLPLPDPNATQAAVAANKSFDAVVGTAWVRVRIASISGTFAAGQGYTVIVTPYVSPGQAQVTITNVASSNISQYKGNAAGPANPLDVQLQGIGDVDVLSEPSGPGAYTTPTHAAILVGIISSVVLVANPDRLYALLVNDSDAVIYLMLGGDAALNQGIRLNAGGGSYEMSKKQGNLYAGAIHAISSVAGKNLLVTEGV